MTAPVGGVDLEMDSVAPENEALLDSSETVIAGRSPMQLAWVRLKRDHVSYVAGIVVVIIAIVAVLAPILSHLGILDPYSFHAELITGFGSMPTGFGGGMSWAHPFGVEPQTGRDILSRVILGIAFSMMIAISAVIISTVLGVIIGLVAGYMGGKTDFWLGRFMDLVLCFPQTLMLLALSPVLKQRIASVLNMPEGSATVSAIYLILVLGFFGWPYLARIIRGQVLTMRSREFVEAAQSLGASRRRILFKELIPNLWAPVIVYVSLTLPLNIGAEAALSFLGVGLQPPTPSLGNILNDSVSYYVADPAYFLLPGLVLVLVVLSFNMFGDGLRDALDPKSGR